MKLRKIAILSLALCCFSAIAQDKVHASLTSYLGSIVGQPVDSIIVKCDLLINQGGSEKQQADIAGVIFNYFAAAPYMGLETVAVHIADNWFLNKKLPWGDDNTYPILYTYAEFNRESLIGKSAPELKMESLNGDTISFREIPADHKILYFYEDGCAQCARQTPAIVSMLNDYSGKSIVLFAIYTQDLRENWEKYIWLNFNKIDNPTVTV